MSAAPPASRRRRPWVVGALVVLVLAALVVIVLRLYSPTADDPGAGPTTAPPASTPTPTETVATVTGCLGGQARDAAMVRTAQATAAHTEVGAVEVATAFVRWLNQYPYPDGLEQVQQSAISEDAPTRDLVAFFEREPDLSGGLVAKGEPYWLSTAPGVYFVEAAEPDTVTASIGTALVRDGELSPSLRGSITVTVAWENGQWAFVRSEGTRTTEDLFAIGTPFGGGC